MLSSYQIKLSIFRGKLTIAFDVHQGIKNINLLTDQFPSFGWDYFIYHGVSIPQGQNGQSSG